MARTAVAAEASAAPSLASSGLLAAFATSFLPLTARGMALIALVEFYIPYLNAKSEERSLKNVMSAISVIYFFYSFSAWTVNLLTEIIKVR